MIGAPERRPVASAGVAHPRTFRFGAQATTAATGAEWAALARRAEDLGYSSLFLPDHFGDQLAPIPALQAAADATTTLRVGALVHGVDYKHPVVLAKEVATLDLLSGGRVEFGLGAGWMTSDYEQAGIVKDGNGIRVSRMEEALAVCRGLWADGPFSHDGEHYRITELEGLPKPVQRPGPQVLIGGGAPRVLGIAARQADIVGINPSLPSGVVDTATGADAVASRLDEKVGWVRDAAGDRFDELELNILVFFAQLTDDRHAVLETIAPMFGVTAADADDVPYAWIGSVGEICDQLRAARDRWGTSYFVVPGDALDAMAPVVAELAGT